VRDRLEIVGGAVGAGEGRQNTRAVAGLRDVNRADLRMRIRRAHQRCIGLSRQGKVVGETALACEQGASSLRATGLPMWRKNFSRISFSSGESSADLPRAATSTIPKRVLLEAVWPAVIPSCILYGNMADNSQRVRWADAATAVGTWSGWDMNKLMRRTAPIDMQDHLNPAGGSRPAHARHPPIDKDSELHPLARWQFQGGLREQIAAASSFTNVTGAKGEL
jgi:hypothetical protein